MPLDPTITNRASTLAAMNERLAALLIEPLVTCGPVGPEPESWIDGDVLYRVNTEARHVRFTAVPVECAEEDWADRVTGYGVTAAQAQMDMHDKLREWNS